MDKGIQVMNTLNKIREVERMHSFGTQAWYNFNLLCQIM